MPVDIPTNNFINNLENIVLLTQRNRTNMIYTTIFKNILLYFVIKFIYNFITKAMLINNDEYFDIKLSGKLVNNTYTDIKGLQFYNILINDKIVLKDNIYNINVINGEIIEKELLLVKNNKYYMTYSNKFIKEYKRVIFEITKEKINIFNELFF